jgi:hypothetical protein
VSSLFDCCVDGCVKTNILIYTTGYIPRRKLSEFDGKENYQVKLSTRFTTLENLYDVDISRT